MKRNKGRNRGITLIALVITIIVLLILAGVSLSMVFDSDGLFRRISDVSIQSELAKIEEDATLIYHSKLMNKLTDGNKEKVTEKEIIDELEKGYKIEEENANKITDIKITPEKIVMIENNSKQVTVEPIYENGTFYYVVVNENKYRIKISEEEIKVERTPTNTITGEAKEKITASSNNNIVTVGEITDNLVTINSSNLTGKDIVTIMQGGIKKEVEITVAKRLGNVVNNYYLYPAGNGKNILCFGLYEKDNSNLPEICACEGIRRVNFKSRRNI